MHYPKHLSSLGSRVRCFFNDETTVRGQCGGKKKTSPELYVMLLFKPDILTQRTTTKYLSDVTIEERLIR